MSKRRLEGGDDGPGKVPKEDADMRKATFAAHLKALNQQFANWVNDQRTAHLGELWTDGVKDYLEHSEALLAEYKDVLDAARQERTAGSNAAKQVSFAATPSATDSKPSSSTSGFAFGAAASSGADASAAPVSTLFGSKPAADKAAAPAFSFKPAADSSAATTSSSAAASTTAAADSAPAFSFGGAAPFSFGGSTTTSSKPADAGNKDAAKPSSLFSFGGSTSASGDAAAPASGDAAGAPKSFFNFPAPSSTAGANPFSFGSAAAAAPAAGQAAAEEEGEDEGPKKFESEVVTNEETGTIVAKYKSKMAHYVKAEGEDKPTWLSKGVGLFMVRTPKENPKKPFVTFTTDSGRVLFIANLPKVMKVQVTGENRVSFCIPWAPDGEGTPSLQTVMFTVPKGKAAELEKELTTLQASMD